MHYDIVMVTYNSEKWLRGCVEALAALEYEKAQLHLVFADNASQDGTLPLLEQLRAEHPEFGGFTIVREVGLHVRTRVFGSNGRTGIFRS